MKFGWIWPGWTGCNSWRTWGSASRWRWRCCLAWGVLLVVGNTIRLAVESRRQEIEVVTLIGATHAFVRRPFLYSGAWYGLGGGVLALVILMLGGNWLASPVAALAESYGAHFALPSLGGRNSVFLLLFSTLLGWLGAWLAVGRHLSDIKPR